MSGSFLQDIEHHSRFWGAERDAYVLVPIRFPDGRVFHDIYTRDGSYSTLADAALNAAVAAKMLAAGVEMVDPDEWAQRGRELADHSPLWTTERHRYVVVRHGSGVSERTHVTINDLKGEVYAVPDEVREQVVERMIASGVPVINSADLDTVLSELREREAQAQYRRSRLSRSCFAESIPKRWLRHRVNTAGSDELIPECAEMSDGYVLRAIEGALPFGHVRAFCPDLVGLMQPGDELWWFRNPKRCWGMLAGQAGYCVVRDGQSVAHEVTVRS